MFAKKTPPDDPQAVRSLAERVGELEARCEALAHALSERDARIEAMALEQRVLARRLELAADQSEKAMAALLDRVERVRVATA